MKSDHLGKILSVSILAAALSAAGAKASTDWTGVYVGGYIGGVFGSTPGERLPNGLVLRPSPSGLVAGGLVGGQYELSYPFVIGVEGDAGYMDSDGKATGVSFGTNSNGHTYTDRTQMPSIFRVRAKLGIDLDQYLFFVAGGESFGDRNVRFTDITTGTDSVRISKHPDGWNAGFGVDYAFSDCLVGRVEYIYDFLNKQTYHFSAIDSDISDRNVVSTLSTVRIAAMWKFY